MTNLEMKSVHSRMQSDGRTTEAPDQDLHLSQESIFDLRGDAFQVRSTSGEYFERESTYGDVRNHLTQDPFGFLAHSQWKYPEADGDRAKYEWLSDFQLRILNLLAIIIAFERSVRASNQDNLSKRFQYLSLAINPITDLVRGPISATRPGFAKYVLEEYLPGLLEMFGIRLEQVGGPTQLSDSLKLRRPVSAAGLTLQGGPNEQDVELAF